MLQLYTSTPKPPFPAHGRVELFYLNEQRMLNFLNEELGNFITDDKRLRLNAEII